MGGSLEVLLCPKDSEPPQDVATFLDAGGCTEWHSVEVPRHGALTRRQLVDFSKHWPLTFRKPSFEPLELTDASKVGVCAEACGCVITDRQGRELAAAGDASSQHPLRHAVM